MKIILISFFIMFSFTSFSQTVHTRTVTATPIQWDEKNEIFKRDTIKSLIKIKNPKILLAYDIIEVIDRDTTKFYLNETPKMEEEDNVIKRWWNDANDDSGRACYVFLFFDKDNNDYTLRIVYTDDECGIEYYMMPLKVDVIPYSINKQK